MEYKGRSYKYLEELENERQKGKEDETENYNNVMYSSEWMLEVEIAKEYLSAAADVMCASWEAWSPLCWH